MSQTGISYRAVLIDLRERKAKIDAAIAAVEDILAVVEPQQYDGPPEPPEEYDAPRIIRRIPTPTGPYSEMTIAAAAIHFLGLMGKPQNTADIVVGLRRGGLSSQSKNLYRTLYNTLNNHLDKGITKEGAKWGLTQWHQQ